MTELPSGWESLPLSDVCLRAMKSDPIATRRSTIRYIDIGSIDGARHSMAAVPMLEAASAPARARQIVHAGDTVFSTVRPYLEKIAYIGMNLDDEFASTGFCVLRPGPRLDARWLFHYSTSRLLLDQVLPHQRGVSYPAVRDKDVFAAKIPVPDIVTQRRIVEVLEDHLSRLDAAEQTVANVQHRLESWKRVTLDGLVRDTASGTTRLRALVSRVEAGRSLGGSAPPAGPNDWGIIKVSAMTWGEFRPRENKKIPVDRADPRYEIRSGDVLVSRANTSEYVGAPVYIEDTPRRLLLSDKSLRLVPRAGIDGRWLASVLAARSTRAQVSTLATGTKDSMRNISQQALLSVTVPEATPDQQTHVIQRARELEEGAHTLRSATDRAELRGTALRRSLLRAAFSGRLT